MNKAYRNPPILDPDNIPETLCLGQFNLHLSDGMATLTFTHVRPDPKAMIEAGTIVNSAVVRARIVTNLENLWALKDLLIQSQVQLANTGVPPATASGGKKH